MSTLTDTLKDTVQNTAAGMGIGATVAGGTALAASMAATEMLIPGSDGIYADIQDTYHEIIESAKTSATGAEDVAAFNNAQEAISQLSEQASALTPTQFADKAAEQFQHVAPIMDMSAEHTKTLSTLEESAQAVEERFMDTTSNPLASIDATGSRLETADDIKSFVNTAAGSTGAVVGAAAGGTIAGANTVSRPSWVERVSAEQASTQQTR